MKGDFCYICRHKVDLPVNGDHNAFNFGTYNDFSGQEHINLVFCRDCSRLMLGFANKKRREAKA